MLTSEFRNFLSLPFKSRSTIPSTIPLTTLPIHLFIYFTPVLKIPEFCFFINKSVNPSSWSRDFPSPDYSYLQLKSTVQRARDIMIHNIYRPQGTSSFISSFAHDSDFSDFFLAAPDNSDVFSLLHHALLDNFVDHILLGDFNLHHPL